MLLVSAGPRQVGILAPALVQGYEQVRTVVAPGPGNFSCIQLFLWVRGEQTAAVVGSRQQQIGPWSCNAGQAACLCAAGEI